MGWTLPASWYTDPAVFEAEKRSIFRRFWHYAGLAERVVEPGDFLTCRAGDVPILVVRDEALQLRAFVSVCRHRGAEMVPAERGSRKSIQCHYHAWTYDLDGSLRAAPGSKNEPGFDRSEFRLVPVQVEIWGPFVFVNPDLEAGPLSAVLGELPSLVNATGIEVDRLRCRVRHRYDIAANWKVVVDNYLECYHCPVAHPSFSALLDVDQYQVREYEYFSVQTGRVKGGESSAAGLRSSEGVEEALHAYLWPNFMLNIYPGPGNVSLNLILPVDVDRTAALYEYCFVDEVGDEEVREFVAFIDQVQQEDTVLCESVQRGLRSGFFDQGKLLLSRERALWHFQRLVYDTVRGRRSSW